MVLRTRPRAFVRAFAFGADPSLRYGHLRERGRACDACGVDWGVLSIVFPGLTWDPASFFARATHRA